MISGLDSGLSGQDSSPGHGHCVVFLNETFYSLSASIQVYQWVLCVLNLMLEGLRPI